MAEQKSITTQKFGPSGGFSIYTGNLCDDEFERSARTKNFLNNLLDTSQYELPDLLCLQEAPLCVAENLAGIYKTVVYEDQAYNNNLLDSGLILASRLPLASYESVRFNRGANITQVAKVALKGSEVAVFNLHKPSGTKNRLRLRETRALSEYAKQIKGIGSVVIAGDFNSLENQSSYKSYIEQGYQATLNNVPTFPSDWSIQNNHPGLKSWQKALIKPYLSRGIQLDNILYKGDIVAHSYSVIDVGQSVSDHAHLSAKFKSVTSLPFKDSDIIDLDWELAA